MTKHKINQKIFGYTVIELLAVVSILVIIAGVVSGILYSTLRGSGKVKVTGEIIQNGQYAISVVRSIIDDSRNVTLIDGVAPDCTQPIPTPGASSITFKRLDNTTTTISCVGPPSYAIASNSASLVNTQSVKIQNCIFSCAQLVSDPYSVPIINVTFTVSDRGTGLFESRASSVFTTSSSLRSYSP